MDFSRKTIQLANEVLFDGTPTKTTLVFIEKVSLALEEAYNAGKREGLQNGKEQERERRSVNSAASHSEWCHDEDCCGQCRFR